MLAPLQPGEIHTAISEKYTLQDLGNALWESGKYMLPCNSKSAASLSTDIHVITSEKYTMQDLGKSKSAASVRKRLRIEQPQPAGEICFLARVRVRPQ